jgi:hypothetical protein
MVMASVAPLLNKDFKTVWQLSSVDILVLPTA